MNQDEFIRLVNGKPWANRACCFEQMDCWGLVVLYFRHVVGVELHQIEDYEAGKDFITCYQQEAEFWVPKPVPAAGRIAVFYKADTPDHVGVMVSPVKCLHASRASGFVRLDAPLNILKNHSRVEYKSYGVI